MGDCCGVVFASTVTRYCGVWRRSVPGVGWSLAGEFSSLSVDVVSFSGPPWCLVFSDGHAVRDYPRG